MVIELLGTHPRRLLQLHASDSAEDTVAHLVVTAAHHLDYLHQQLASQAQAAAAGLTRVAAGKAQINSLGVLQNSATQIDILAARRADGVERLKEIIHAYQDLAARADAVTRPPHQRSNAMAQTASPPSSEPPSRVRHGPRG